MLINYDRVKGLKFRDLIIIGMNNSGITPLTHDLQVRYKVDIFPQHNNHYYPHMLQKSPCINDKSTLLICLVKDPYFWYQSLKKNPKDLISPTNNFLDYLIFNGKGYDSAIHLWNEYVTNYLDPSKFPPKNTIIMKYEDYLHNFHKIIDFMDNLLEIRHNMGLPFPRNNKEMEWFRAIDYYKDINRYNNLNKQELFKINSYLNDTLLERLTYKKKLTVNLTLPLTYENLSKLNFNKETTTKRIFDNLSTSDKIIIENTSESSIRPSTVDSKYLKPVSIVYLDDNDNYNDKDKDKDNDNEEDLTLYYKKATHIDNNNNNNNNKRTSHLETLLVNGNYNIRQLYRVLYK